MLLTSLFSLLAPHDCLGCAAEGLLLCRGCRCSLEPAILRCYRCHFENATARTCHDCVPHTALGALYAATRYSGLAKDIVWKLKFGRAKAAASEMGDMLALCLSMRRLPRDTIVTHVPTATSRVRQRGYDQASLLAKAFARRYGLEYASLLARSGQHKQVGANKAVRLEQLADEFYAVRPGRISGRRILLIDDVVTTGATLETCAGALRAAGAASVDAAVFAQA